MFKAFYDFTRRALGLRYEEDTVIDETVEVEPAVVQTITKGEEVVATTVLAPAKTETRPRTYYPGDVKHVESKTTLLLPPEGQSCGFVTEAGERVGCVSTGKTLGYIQAAKAEPMTNFPDFPDTADWTRIIWDALNWRTEDEWTIVTEADQVVVHGSRIWAKNPR